MANLHRFSNYVEEQAYPSRICSMLCSFILSISTKHVGIANNTSNKRQITSNKRQITSNKRRIILNKRWITFISESWYTCRYVTGRQEDERMKEDTPLAITIDLQPEWQVQFQQVAETYIRFPNVCCLRTLLGRRIFPDLIFASLLHAPLRVYFTSLPNIGIFAAWIPALVCPLSSKSLFFSTHSKVLLWRPNTKHEVSVGRGNFMDPVEPSLFVLFLRISGRVSIDRQ